MDDEQERQQQARVAAENMELLLQHIEGLRNSLRPARSLSPNLLSAAQSWTTLKTVVTIITLAASFVVASLTIGHWWGVADTNFDLLKRIDRSVVRIIGQLQDHDHRLRVLERQRGIPSPPDEGEGDE